MFSIIVPLYNKEKSIEKTIIAIISAFSKYKYEIIIVNDGSLDNSLKIVSEISNKNIVIVNQDNSGVSTARNTGIKKAKYPYLVFVDADDIVLPHIADEYSALINKTSDSCNLFSVGYAIKNNDKIIKYNTKKALGKENWFGIVENTLEVISKYKGSCFISCSSICVKKDFLFLNDIFFPEGITHTEDVSFYYDIIIKSGVSYSSRLCVYYQLDTENRSSSSKPLEERYVNIKIKKYLNNNQLDYNNSFYSRSFLAKNYIHLISNCIENNNYLKYKKNIKEAHVYYKYMSDYYKLVYCFFRCLPFGLLVRFLNEK